MAGFARTLFSQRYCCLQRKLELAADVLDALPPSDFALSIDQNGCGLMHACSSGTELMDALPELVSFRACNECMRHMLRHTCCGSCYQTIVVHEISFYA